MNKNKNIRVIDYSYVVSTLPSPLALALRSHVCFASKMFIGGDDYIPGSSSRRINHEAECMAVPCALLQGRCFLQNSFQ